MSKLEDLYEISKQLLIKAAQEVFDERKKKEFEIRSIMHDGKKSDNVSLIHHAINTGDFFNIYIDDGRVISFQMGANLTSDRFTGTYSMYYEVYQIDDKGGLNKTTIRSEYDFGANYTRYYFFDCDFPQES